MNKTDKSAVTEKTVENQGYFNKRPVFENKGPSKFSEKISSIATVFIVIAAGLLFYFALLRMPTILNGIKSLLKVLTPILYGLGIAFLLNPIVIIIDNHLRPYLYEKFGNSEKKKKRLFKVSRMTGIFCGLAILIFIIIMLLNMIIPELYKSIRSMIITVPYQLNELVDSLMTLDVKNTTVNQFLSSVIKESSEFIENWLKTDLLKQINTIMTDLTVGVINIITGVFNFLIGIIISVYVLFSKETFASQGKKLIYAIFRPSHANVLIHVVTKGNYIFGGFIIGKIIDSIIIGILCFIGLSFLHMPYTLLVSVIVGVTNVIPFFGPYIGAIPSAVLIMLNDPKMGLYFIIFVFLLQQLDGNVIGPKILGDYTGLSVFWVVFAIIVGGGMFGVPGMILGVPTFAVLYYVASMYIENRLRKKKLPEDTQAYANKSYVDSSGCYVRDEQDLNDNMEKEDE